MSYAKTVLDCDQCNAFYHFAQGYQFDDIEEIFENIKEVGPGNHYLGAAHTRRSNLFEHELQSNITYEQWFAEGSKTAEQSALEEAKRRLERYELPPMDPELDKALLEFINRRESEISPVAAWLGRETISSPYAC